MARDTTNPIMYEYPMVVSALNRRVNRKRLQPGELSLAVGLDGRYTGALKTFPGMLRLRQLEDTTFYDMQYLTLQKGATAKALRGFLALILDGATVKLKFYYYDEGTSAWGSQALTGLTLTATSRFAVAGSSHYAYIAAEGNAPQVLYHNGTLFVQAAMGPGAAFDLPGAAGLLAPTLGVEGANDTGYLETGGVYGIAYRFYDPARDVYSDISGILSHTVVGSNVTLTITNPYAADPDGAYIQGYRVLQVFRTLTTKIVDSYFEAGLLFLEGEYDLDGGADCWPATVKAGTAEDKWLKYVEIYDPRRDGSGVPPQGHAIAFYEGTNFIGGENTEGSVVVPLQWTALHRDAPEIFPVEGYSLQWDISDGLIHRFVRAGDMLYAFADNAVFQIAKAGSQMRIMRLQGNRSLVNYHAATELGRDVLAVTDLGVTIIDGADGSVKTLGALDRLLWEDWVTDLGSLFMVADGRMGCTFVVNPVLAEAAVVWHVTGGMSTLDDCNFVGGCSGPHPEEGGRGRAWFVTSKGVVLTPDVERAGTGTMLGVVADKTINGTASGDGATSNTLVDDGADFDASMVGAYVYLFAADGSYQRRTIHEVYVAFDLFNVSVNWTVKPKAGDRYTISPVPFRVRAWGVPPAGSPQEFGRRKVRDMSVHISSLVDGGGAVAAGNAVSRIGVCRNQETAPSSATLKVVALDENPSDMHGNVNSSGVCLEPWVEVIAAGISFELLSVGVDGTITVSRNSVD